MFIQKEGLKRTLTLREIKRKPEVIAIKKKRAFINIYQFDRF